MKALIIAALIGLNWVDAFGLGPPSPASLLPPVGSPTKGHNKGAPELDLAENDPIFDLDDPSTLLEIDDKAMTPDSKKIPSAKTAYDKKLEEASEKLATQSYPKFKEVPPLDSKKPLLPLLTVPGNTIAKQEVKQVHPPLLAAMNPPPAPVKPALPTQPPPDFSLMPMMAGIDLPGVSREPTNTPPTPPLPAVVTAVLPVPKTTALTPLPGVPDVAIILSNNQFFPSKVRLREGIQTRLIFTTTNKKPAALVMERLQIQRWIAKEKDPNPSSEIDRARWEVNRELSSSKVTEIVLDPKQGSYSFHDAITGASGEIEVEGK